VEDLGLIEWTAAKTPARASLYPYRLPSKATAIIVKYRPQIAISCVIPPQVFKASYRLGSRTSRKRGVEEVVTPILLMTQAIAEMPSNIRTRGVVEGYTLWALRLQDGELSKTKAMTTSPYLFGNVWDRGAICFGGMTPESLMQAFNYYWSSGFNDELFKDQGHHICRNKNHRYVGPPEPHGLVRGQGGPPHNGCLCSREYKHECSCSRKTSHRHQHCGCTSVTDSKKCKGSCIVRLVREVPELKNLYEIVTLTFSMKGFPFLSSWGEGSPERRLDSEVDPDIQVLWEHWQTKLEASRANRSYTRRVRMQHAAGHCACCMSIVTVVNNAKRKANLERKKLGPRQISKHTVVEDEPYPGCGCGWRHKNTCDCRNGRCQCPCICKCCLKTCGHGPCSCDCCLEKCNCPCNCSNSVKFKEHLGAYHDKVLPNQPWKDRTTLICGEAYWASPSTSPAVLVTNHPYLLMRIPEKYRRKMSCGNGIIALGREDGDCWEFSSGTYKFRVPTSLVAAN